MKYIILTFFIVSCSDGIRNSSKNTVIDAKKLYDSLKDPYIKFIPDSLKSWIPVFDTILRNDQKFRSVEDKDLLAKHPEQKILDSINQLTILKFLNMYGYPDIKQVGFKGMTAIKLVLQHAPLATQEKYYNFMKQAYIEKKIPGSTLAMFEDRINMRNHRYQYYGTQVLSFKGSNKYTVYPVVNVDSLNVYRKRMGLSTIEEYLKTFYKSDWDILEYKNKHLPPAIKEFKITNAPGIHFDPLLPYVK